MKRDVYYLLLIFGGISVMLLTSLLLEWDFIQRDISRKIVVWSLMLLEAFVVFKKLFNGESGGPGR